MLRRRRVLLAAILLVALAATTAALWYSHRLSAGPVPPAVPPDPNEPEVATVIERLRGEVLREPRSAQAWGRLGQAFLANEMDAESQICFTQAERLDPANPRWPYYQGGVLLNQGEREAALPYLQRAVQRSAVAAPDNLVPVLVLGETLLIVGRLDEAEEQFRRVLDRQPDDVRAQYDMALTAAARQDWQTSQMHLLRCLESPFVQQKTRIQLALVSQRLGDSAAAQRYREQAAALPADQDWPDPFVTEYLKWAMKKKSRYRLAETLEAAGRLREAVAVLMPIAKDYPNDSLSRIALGRILGRLGESPAAEHVLREALALAPEKIQTHYYLGLVLFTEAEQAVRNGDHDRAESLYREAVQRAQETLAVKPDYGLAYMVLGLSQKGLGQRAEARTALQEAVRCNPEHAELKFYLGQILAENGETQKARESLERALRSAPPTAGWRPLALSLLAALAALEKNRS